MTNVERVSLQRITPRILWEKFPKFVIGFLVASLYFTFVLKPVMSKSELDLVLSVTSSMSSWWFALAFLGIGLGCNVQDLYAQLKEGKLLALYVLGQMFDLMVSLGFAYFAFSGHVFGRPVLD